MNDPNDTDDGLLDHLETEYMQLISKGDYAAIDYALESSPHYNRVVHATLMHLMLEAVPERNPEKTAVWAQVARTYHMEVLAKEVAPAWARRESDRHQREAAKMEVEFREPIDYGSPPRSTPSSIPASAGMGSRARLWALARS